MFADGAFELKMFWFTGQAIFHELLGFLQVKTPGAPRWFLDPTPRSPPPPKEAAYYFPHSIHRPHQFCGEWFLPMNRNPQQIVTYAIESVIPAVIHRTRLAVNYRNNTPLRFALNRKRFLHPRPPMAKIIDGPPEFDSD